MMSHLYFMRRCFNNKSRNNILLSRSLSEDKLHIRRNNACFVNRTSSTVKVYVKNVNICIICNRTEADKCCVLFFPVKAKNELIKTKLHCTLS